jgi:hypothetical protein
VRIRTTAPVAVRPKNVAPGQSDTRLGSVAGSPGRCRALGASWSCGQPSGRGIYEVAPRPRRGENGDAVSRESSEVSARSVRASPGRLNQNVPKVIVRPHPEVCENDAPQMLGLQPGAGHLTL